jgi:hypothetical protein
VTRSDPYDRRSGDACREVIKCTGLILMRVQLLPEQWKCRTALASTRSVFAPFNSMVPQ